MKSTSDAPVDAGVVAQACHWLMLHWQGPLEDAQQTEFETWHHAAAEHRRAWARLEHLQRSLTGLPKAQSLAVLRQQPQLCRRDALKLLSALLMVGGAGWLAERELPWREALSDISTGTGETLQQTLADGTRLWLNTSTALNVHISHHARRVRLISGEILLDSGHDPAYALAPLVVETPAGEIQALGTRFSVRRLNDGCRVQLFEGALQVRPQQEAPIQLLAGQSLWFSANSSKPAGFADTDSVAWSAGRLVARQTPLGAFLQDLSRYRRGVVRWTPAVAHLPLTGVFPLADTELILSALEQTLAVRVQRMTRYWISIDALG